MVFGGNETELHPTVRHKLRKPELERMLGDDSKETGRAVVGSPLGVVGV